MLVILFRSRLTDEAGEDFSLLEEHLMQRVQAMPESGFVKLKSYQADDGERLAVVWWRDRESLERWRTDPEHRQAQHLGRTRWFASYELEIAEVLRSSSVTHDSTGELSPEEEK
ncbi:antibiotic biosynthesis monooxygenase family protein [Saccharopolyspora phatthalungensis]|uniref:Heme-degrading monooxygenase HmoA n=1 Tax=Saccharopolyspora phatthalungensis TaxID=664693 RepID=A0A840QKY1_9PSEU|nr:antibiotic biosynthesis monooxygenase [Saccharopolyspora phatthalungensis]MBB5159823.1 heme-degrading monooxygenase HmoA [Saccharopolyspora phatthalungensis]